LSDALLIDAQEILTESQKAPISIRRLELEIWNAKNEALYARIWKSLSVDIRNIMTPSTTKKSAVLWESIVARFGLTKAQERYNLLRDACALKLEGSDYFTYQSKWLKFRADLRNLEVSIDDVIHDLFIQNLGSWQAAFVKTRLDEFFATGGNGESIDNIDIDDLMRQLQYRAQTVPKRIVLPLLTDGVRRRRRHRIPIRIFQTRSLRIRRRDAPTAKVRGILTMCVIVNTLRRPPKNGLQSTPRVCGAYVNQMVIQFPIYQDWK
jgi:hypothetical protein